MFAPVPPWDGAHPIVVHFPIALFITAPVFIVLAAIWWNYRHAFAISALIMLILGSIGAILAVESGEAASDYAEDTVGVTQAVEDHIEEHEEAGELSRNIFIGLTVLYAGVIALPLVTPRARQFGFRVVLTGVYLIIYILGLGQLSHTGHLGGLLVHEYGVHAPLGPQAPAGSQPAPGTEEREDDE